ncbi:MAG: MgtC/SapB family protein [Dehalococcoidia bacterium]|nr:MgtC/SapB family protein [Dehalococcoidia bacterium]
MATLLDTLTEVEATGRFILAALLGALIGFDRERMNKAAGIRTHMLVAMGAALFMVGTQLFIQDLSADTIDPSPLRLDPVAVIAGIVTGVGFIGAGQIFHDRGNVQGLTSAAGIWATAGIGMLVGMGHYVVPVIATLLVFLIIAVLARFDLAPDATPETGSGSPGAAHEEPR